MKLDHRETAQLRAAEQWWFAEASRSPDLVVDLHVQCGQKGVPICVCKRILDARCPCQGANSRAVRRAHVLVGGAQVFQRG
jgi:hypothetical protein